MSWIHEHILPLIGVSGRLPILHNQTALQAFGLHSTEWDILYFKRRIFLYTFFYHDVFMKHESHLSGIRRMKELQGAAFSRCIARCLSTGW
jgi:hypothetical protein